MDASAQYDVFLSHNSADKPAVETIGTRLREAGFDPFLDKWHLVPGKSWQTELAEAMDASASVAIFFGPNGEGAWHNEEMQVALVKAVRTRDDYRVIPVLLPGADPSQVDGFMELRTWVDFRQGLDDEASFARLTAAIKGVAPDSADGLLELPDEPRPYRGIERFEGEQHQFFFGRDDEIRRLIERLEQDRLVVVVGASGSGKSSLARAGFYTDVAERKQPGIREWRRIMLMPKTNPLLQLAANLVAHLPESQRPALIKTFIDDFQNSPDGLITALTTLFPNPDHPVLLLVDQFEELFTQRPPADQDQTEWRERTASFAANLLAAANHKLDWLRIVVTLRADFVDRFVGGDFPDYRTLLERRQFWLGPMGEDDLREVIVRPATKRGAFFEKGLVERILAEMRGEASALPLLEEALGGLWDQRRGPWLTHQAYDNIGGVGGALADKADRILDNLNTSDQAIARRVFLGLVQLGEGTRDTRRRAAVASLIAVLDEPQRVEEVIRRFSAQGVRLITLSADAEGRDTAEVTHEALFEHWRQLDEWLDSSRDDLRFQRRLDQAARHWKDHSRAPGLLWRPPDLALLGDFHGRAGDDMTTTQLDFYLASKQAEEQRLSDERRQQTRLRRYLQIATTAAVVAALLACVSFTFFRKAEINLQKADHNLELALLERAEKEKRLEEANHNLGLALLERAEKYREEEKHTGAFLAAGKAIGFHEWGGPFEEYPSLLKPGESEHLRALTIARESAPRRVLPGVLFRYPGSSREAIAANQQQQLLAVQGNDFAIDIWDLNSKNRIATWPGHTAYLSALAFSPIGNHIVSASRDRTIRLWDTSGVSKTLQSGIGDVFSAQFSPDGKWLAWGGDDRHVHLFNVEDGTDRNFSSQGQVIGLTFSHDSSLLVTGDDDGVLRLHNLERIEEPTHSWQGHTGLVWSLAFHPKSEVFVSCGQDKTVKVWKLSDVEAGRTVAVTTMSIYRDQVMRVKFSEDGGWLAVSGRDGTVRIWNASNWQLEATLEGHQLLHADFSSESEVATFDSGGTIRLWRLRKHEGRVDSLRGHSEMVGGLAYHPNGTQLASGGWDGTLRLWNVLSGDSVELAANSGRITRLAFDVNGSSIFAGTGDGAVFSLTMPDGSPRFTVKDTGTKWITGIKMSPNGDFLAVCGLSGKLAILNPSDGSEIKGLVAHPGTLVQSVDINANGSSLVTAVDSGHIVVWDCRTWERMWVKKPHQGRAKCMFSPDGSHVVSVGDDGRILWIDGAKGTITRKIETDHAFLAMAMTRDGDRIITSGRDKTIRIWDTTTEQQLAIMPEDNISYLRVFAVSPDDRVIAYGSRGAVIRFMDLSSPKALPIDPSRFYFDGLNVRLESAK